eukprot:TRINITY_DN3316_c0_g1_i1.p1 TRINITY_DN3316_c0_g1~~TRINITY_DN3316_c0_g1_i1.p1  ORF type:complete len:336 (+),score=74.22 TRINITY_DN3316_c0_g1_i1:103-1110(+)
MIDFYDVLGVSLDADADDIKKASRKLWLQTHPDKVNAQAGTDSGDANGMRASQGNASEKFNEVMLAKEVLSDAERRKNYDTFGFDLGEEKPEMEVWNIGLTHMGAPLGGFLLKTVFVRLALWFIAFKWIGRIIIFGGIVSGIMYWLDFTYREFKMRSAEAFPFIVQFAVVNAVILLFWIWPLLADSICVAYLVAEVAGLGVFIENWKVGVGIGFGCLVVARIIRGWWLWLIGFEFMLGIVILIALTISTCIMRLWIDNVHTARGDQIKAWRLSMRKERARLQKEIADLKQKQQIANVVSDKDAVAAHRKKIAEEAAYWEKKVREEKAKEQQKAKM